MNRLNSPECLTAKAIGKMSEKAEAGGFGKAKVNYRLRDWLISRQRYWGAPIPIMYDESGQAVPVPADQLPVRLPENVEFKPTGESPLRSSEEFMETMHPESGARCIRESDTMDTFVDSCGIFSVISAHRTNIRQSMQG